MPRLLRLSQAAQYLGINPRTLNRWTLAGAVPVVRIPGQSQVHYDIRDLERMIDENKSAYATPDIDIGTGSLKHKKRAVS